MVPELIAGSADYFYFGPPYFENMDRITDKYDFKENPVYRE